MAYYNGSANDMSAMRQALIDACVSEGWAWDGPNEVLRKGVMFVQLQVVSGYLRLRGRTSLTGGNMDHVVQIGPFSGYSAAPLPSLTYPIGYELFLFDQEIYCVINYSVDCYQWCAFGKSTVQGFPGSGMWVGASGNNAVTSYGSGISISSGAGGASYGSTVACPALFWRSGQSSNVGNAVESMVHSDLDGTGWWAGTTYIESPVGVGAAVPLINLLPNSWNSEAVLLPIRAYKLRTSNKISLVADLEYARYTRVDNYTPGEIITIGSDRWKIFPWYRKNSASRDGGNWRIDHSGTLGWAIRYQGA